MRAYEVQAGFGFDNLKIVDRPTPKPGPGQVRVAMKAWSLNYRDLLVVSGAYNPRMKLPIVPLSDGAGEVVEVGSGVTRVKPGDRVAGCFMQRWIAGAVTDEIARSALGGAIDGVLAEEVIFEEQGVTPFPEHLSFEEASTLPCAGLTAWHALVNSGNVKAGDTVLVQGTGGVSMFALQFAAMHGARVIVTSSSDAKLSKARQNGAAETINYKSTPEWGKKALELTGGVDHVIEVGGAGTLDQSLRAVRPMGHVALIGVLAGGQAFNWVPILMKSIRMQGIFVGSREMFEAMNRAIGFHRLKPIIDRTFDFTAAREAMEYMKSGAHFGKVVIRR